MELVFRVIVELLFIQTARLFLRLFGIGVGSNESLLPWKRQNGQIVVQEWAAIILGLFLCIVIGAVVVGLLSR
jgi:hypothetical protein